MRERKGSNGDDGRQPRPDRCRACSVRRGRAFCNFVHPTLSRFKLLGGPRFFQTGEIVFQKGHSANGVWVLCEGEVELTTFSRGKTPPMVRQALPGDVLGLDEAISGKRLRTTAIALAPCRLRYIPRSEFHRFVTQDINACLRMVHYL